jgi:predicted porin
MLHRKKLLTLALAAVVGAPALASAQTGTVVLYGRLYPEMLWSHGHGATSPGTSVSILAAPLEEGDTPNLYGLQASNSRLGIRGEERLRAGLKAFFQIEQTINVDTGGGTLASRDTFVGLESDAWGTVKLGNFDTVYKNLGDTLSFLGISSGNFVSNSNVISKSPMGDASAGSFHLRRANSVQYETPDFFGGLGALVQFSPDEAETSNRNAYLWSMGVKYENGPLYLAVAHEIHRDTFGGSRTGNPALANNSNQNARSKDKATRATVRYTFGNSSIEGDVARLDYDESGGANGRFRSYEHNTYLVSFDHRMGPWRFAASAAWGDNGSCSLVNADCSTDGLKGHQVSLGASYSLSRRTQVFLIGARLTNGKSARYNNADQIDPPPGMDIDQVALGISHSF